MLDKVIAGIQEKLVMLSLISRSELVKDENFCDYGISVNGMPKLLITHRSYRIKTKQYQLIKYTPGKIAKNTDYFENEEDLLERMLELLDDIIKEVV